MPWRRKKMPRKAKPKMDLKRPLSWSAISCFEYNKDDWYRKYVLGEKDKTSKEMEYGKMIGEKLAFDSKFLPQVPRLPIFEHRLLVKFGKIPMVGYIDSLSLDHKTLYEFKTGKNEWTQARADKHQQLDCYLFMLYLIERIVPEQVKCLLHWLPTQETLESMKDNDSKISFIEPFKVHSFETKRTLKDILLFGARIKKVWKEMQEYRPASRKTTGRHKKTINKIT